MSEGDLAAKKSRNFVYSLNLASSSATPGCATDLSVPKPRLADGAVRLRLADANMFLDVRDHAQPIRILVRALRVSGGEKRFSKNCDSGVLNTYTYEKLRTVNASESCPAFLSQYAHCG